MKVGGAVAVLGIGMVASQIGTPHLLTTYECDTDGRKCVRYTQCFFALDWPPFIWRKG